MFFNIRENKLEFIFKTLHRPRKTPTFLGILNFYSIINMTETLEYKQ